MKQIKPNPNSSDVSKRNAETISGQDLMTSSAMIGHCDLPVHHEDISTYIFVYNEIANLNSIMKSVKRNRSPARVDLAISIEGAHMIIFQMNRAAYLQVCHQTFNNITEEYIYIAMYILNLI